MTSLWAAARSVIREDLTDRPGDDIFFEHLDNTGLGQEVQELLKTYRFRVKFL